MQPLFTALNTWNEQLCRETYRKCNLTVYPSVWVRTILQIIAIVVTLGTGVTYFVAGFFYDMPGEFRFINVLNIAIGALLLYHLLSEPKKSTAREMKRLAQKYGTVQVLTQDEFFEDCVYHRASLSETVRVVDYRDLLCVKQTKHYILMFTRAQSVLIVEKNGVTNGASETLYRFLREKREARKEEA